MGKRKANTAQLELFDIPKVVTTTLYEYLIIITPSDEITRYVKKMNAEVNKVLGNEIKDPPFKAHITLVYYKGPLNMDELFMTAVNELAAQTKCFTVKINGFDYFEDNPDSNTVFLSIENKKDVAQIHEFLISRTQLPIHDFTPHISIKRHVKSGRTPIVKEFLGKIDYHTEFLCDRVSILKREIVGKKKISYVTIYEAPFLPA